MLRTGTRSGVGVGVLKRMMGAGRKPALNAYAPNFAVAQAYAPTSTEELNYAREVVAGSTIKGGFFSGSSTELKGFDDAAKNGDFGTLGGILYQVENGTSPSQQKFEMKENAKLEKSTEDNGFIDLGDSKAIESFAKSMSHVGSVTLSSTQQMMQHAHAYSQELFQLGMNGKITNMSPGVGGDALAGSRGGAQVQNFGGLGFFPGGLGLAAAFGAGNCWGGGCAPITPVNTNQMADVAGGGAGLNMVY